MISFTDDELIAAVKSSVTMSQVLRILGDEKCKSRTRNFVQKRIQELNLNTSHFLGQAHARGITRIGMVYPKKLTIEEFFVHGDFKRATKNRLFQEGLKEKKCEWCELTEWRGQPISLELDHIDGDKTNNTLSNLRILCPNCHAQTPTYRGRNIKKHKRR